MYQPNQQKTAIRHQADQRKPITIHQEPDGLAAAFPEGKTVTSWEEQRTVSGVKFDPYAKMTARLAEWLTDLRLLRHVPLTYLVPDPQLLPVESIRFFHVDQTWTDRLLEGALSAANIGMADLAFTLHWQVGIREKADEKLKKIAEPSAWKPGQDPMTGMLIRSELVRRWPEMIVRAFDKPGDTPSGPIPLLRKEPVTRDIMIVLFAGRPRQVEIREPEFATRFGVESDDNDPPYVVNLRDGRGNFVTNERLDIALKNSEQRVLDIDKLSEDIKAKSRWKGKGDNRQAPGSRDVALNLEQLPYVQTFIDNHSESKGSQPPPPDLKVYYRRGRRFILPEGF